MIPVFQSSPSILKASWQGKFSFFHFPSPVVSYSTRVNRGELVITYRIVPFCHHWEYTTGHWQEEAEKEWNELRCPLDDIGFEE